MTKSWIVRSSCVISIATATSRVLGFIRDMVIANLFGTNPAAQAFFVAFRIPNSLRDIVGEGSTNAAIVPVLTEYKTLKDNSEFLHISRVLFNILAVALLLITTAGIIFSPVIVRIIAPGFLADRAQYSLTVLLNRIMFPYLILIGLTAYAMGVLNSVKHFAAPAFGPCLLNIASIILALTLCPKFGVTGLVAGVLVGGVLQLALNLFTMRRNGITISFKDGLKHEGVKRIMRLFLPRLVGTSIYQINLTVNTMISSLSRIVGDGGVAAMYYADRLIQFPLAIFGFAVAQVALPKMSQEFASGDTERLKDTLSFSLRSILFVMVPSGAGLAILGNSIIKALFQRGEFTTYSTMITGSALFYYSFGLFAYGCVKLLVSAFYSMQDTRTPLKTAAIALSINITLNLILMWPLKIGGLALASSVSAFVNFIMLFVILKRRIGDFGTREIMDSFMRILLASMIMVVIIKILLVTIPGAGLFALLGIIIIGIMVFLVSSYACNVREARNFVQWISKNR